MASAEAKIAAVGQINQRAHVIESEAEFAAPPDKCQALLVLLVIGAMPAFGARWRRQKPDSPIVADGLDVDAVGSASFPIVMFLHL